MKCLQIAGWSLLEKIWYSFMYFSFTSYAALYDHLKLHVNGVSKSNESMVQFQSNTATTISIECHYDLIFNANPPSLFEIDSTGKMKLLSTSDFGGYIIYVVLSDEKTNRHTYSCVAKGEHSQITLDYLNCK